MEPIKKQFNRRHSTDSQIQDQVSKVIRVPSNKNYTSKQVNQYQIRQSPEIKSVISSVGLIQCRKKVQGQKECKVCSVGTGTQIFPRIVLTCAHCFQVSQQYVDIHSWREQIFFEKIRKDFHFYRPSAKEAKQISSLNNSSSQILASKSMFKIERIIISSKYIDDQSNDWALLILENKSQTGEKNPINPNSYFSIITNEGDETSFSCQLPAYYIGFYLDKSSISSIGNPYLPSYNLSKVDYRKNQLLYTLQTESGCSGGPIIYVKEVGGKYKYHVHLLGIHKLKQVRQGKIIKEGVLLDEEFRKAFLLWKKMCQFKKSSQPIFQVSFVEYFTFLKKQRINSNQTFASSLSKKQNQHIFINFLSQIIEVTKNYLFLLIKCKKTENAIKDKKIPAQKPSNQNNFEITRETKDQTIRLLTSIRLIFDRYTDEIHSFRITHENLKSLIQVLDILKKEIVQEFQTKISLAYKNLLKSLINILAELGLIKSIDSVLKQLIGHLLNFIQDKKSQEQLTKESYERLRLQQEYELDIEFQFQRLIKQITQLLNQYSIQSVNQLLKRDKSTINKILQCKIDINQRFDVFLIKSNSRQIIPSIKQILQHSQGNSKQKLEKIRIIVGKANSILKSYCEQNKQLNLCFYLQNMCETYLKHYKNKESENNILKSIMAITFKKFYDNKTSLTNLMKSDKPLDKILDELIHFIKRGIEADIVNTIQSDGLLSQDSAQQLIEVLSKWIKRQFMYSCVLTQKIYCIPFYFQRLQDMKYLSNKFISNQIQSLEAQQQGKKNQIKQHKQAKEYHQLELKYMQRNTNSDRQAINDHQFKLTQLDQKMDIAKKRLVQIKVQRQQYEILKVRPNQTTKILRARKQSQYSINLSLKQKKDETIIFSIQRLLQDLNLHIDLGLNVTKSDSKVEKMIQYSKLKNMPFEDESKVYYNNIGRVLVSNRGNHYQLYGTGTLIGKKVVLTSYQTLSHQLESRSFIHGIIKFQLKRYDKYEQSFVTKVKFSRQFNWAFLFLDRELNEGNPPDFTLITHTNNINRSWLVGKSYYCEIIGYQQNEDNKDLGYEKDKNLLRRSQGTIYIQETYTYWLQYKLSATEKMTGAPLIIYPTGQYHAKPFILAIHIEDPDLEEIDEINYSFYKEEFNYGNKIIKQILHSTEVTQKIAEKINEKNNSKQSDQKVKQDFPFNAVHENSYIFSTYFYEKSKFKFITVYNKKLKIADVEFKRALFQDFIDFANLGLFFNEINDDNIVFFRNSNGEIQHRLFYVKIKDIVSQRKHSTSEEQQGEEKRSYSKQYELRLQQMGKQQNQRENAHKLFNQIILNFYAHKQVNEIFENCKITELRNQTIQQIQAFSYQQNYLERLQSISTHTLKVIKFDLQNKNYPPKAQQVFLRFDHYFQNLKRLLQNNEKLLKHKSPIIMKFHPKSLQVQQVSFNHLMAFLRYLIIEKKKIQIQKCLHSLHEKEGKVRKILEQFAIVASINPLQQKAHKKINSFIDKQGLQRNIESLLFDEPQFAIQRLLTNIPLQCQMDFDQFCQTYYNEEYLLLKHIQQLIEFQQINKKYTSIQFLKNATKLLCIKILDEMQALVYNLLYTLMPVDPQLMLDERLWEQKFKIVTSQQRLSPETYEQQFLLRANRLKLLDRVQKLQCKQYFFQRILDLKAVRQRYMGSYKSDLAQQYREDEPSIYQDNQKFQRPLRQQLSLIYQQPYTIQLPLRQQSRTKIVQGFQNHPQVITATYKQKLQRLIHKTLNAYEQKSSELDIDLIMLHEINLFNSLNKSKFSIEGIDFDRWKNIIEKIQDERRISTNSYYEF